ncbi:MAG: amidohydrolase family protein [Verrucomicrobiota bacterium]|jgi:predicted TIM-barrel fold metal-dependent hydrolase|nr:amidohydrolase family protein [Verrucomicrobiota bacterium]MDP7051058.1 amidohydrolase family protein [Verrucomicrobiota bacterium]
MNRRQFIATAAVATTGCASLSRNDKKQLPIVDTHQHLWDLDRFKLAWLDEAPPVLKRSFHLSDYLAATKGMNIVKAVYLEVDVIPEQQKDEARFVTEISRDPNHPTVGGVISGRPEKDDFARFISPYRDNPYIKGLRRLMETTPDGFCLQPRFIESVRLLGNLGKHFEITIQPTQLNDALKLVKGCSDTQFVIDHCGTADPKAFLPESQRGGADPMHQAKPWQEAMSRLADQPNTVCKISGIVAHATKDWSAAQLAPIVNHCLDRFGPERVMFGGDWPVCLLGARYDQWVNALKEVVSSRTESERRKLFYQNAMRTYQLA